MTFSTGEGFLARNNFSWLLIIERLCSHCFKIKEAKHTHKTFKKKRIPVIMNRLTPFLNYFSTNIYRSISRSFLALSISSLHLYQATTQHFSIHTDTHTYMYICVHIQLRYWYVYVAKIVTTSSRFARSPIKVTHGCTFS